VKSSLRFDNQMVNDHRQSRAATNADRSDVHGARIL
jgi:hypothetical protein